MNDANLRVEPNESAASKSASGLSTDDLRMIAAIRHAWHTVVAPEVKSEMARTMCDFGTSFLDKLLIKYTVWPDILRKQVRQEADVLRRAVALLASHGKVNRCQLDEANAALQQITERPLKSLEQLEQSHRQVEAALEQIFPMLVRDTSVHTPANLLVINELLSMQVAAIRASENEFNLAVQARAKRHEELVGARVTVTRDRLESYLRERYPERRELRIESFLELPGGSSKATILCQVQGFEQDGVTPLVVRLDREAGSTDTRVMSEVSTLRQMFAGGFPVPEVVLVEPDATKLGVAFIIVRQIDGQLGGGMWHADRQLCDAETARELARLLARMHNLDVVKLKLGGALNTQLNEHPMKQLIANIRALWSSRKMEPNGTLEACLSWLEQHMPPAPPRPSLIHGDVSFHNIMVRDKKVAGLLDWELSHLGDPAEDLSYARLCIEQLIPWDEFLAEYVRHGGAEYDEARGDYYAIWRGVRNLVYTVTAHHSFHTDANPDMRWGFFSTYQRLVLLEAAEKMAASGVRARG